MHMEDQGENFDQLRQLLTLKKHEVPPPGYFNKLPGEVISRIRVEQNVSNCSTYSRFDAEAPWLTRFWQALAARPVFAGGFGAAVCSLLLAGIFLAEKPAPRPHQAAETIEANPFIAASGLDVAPVTLEKPSIVAASNLNNSTPQNLFELVQPFQTAPVALQPNQ